MPSLKKLTETSFILENDFSEKIGIVIDYTNVPNSEKSGVELFSTDGVINFKSISEISELLGEEIIIKDKEKNDSTTNTKSISGYPINDTDSIHDVIEEEGSLPTFRKSMRSKKRFYPGWWIVPTENGSSLLPRLTISVESLDEKSGIHGPYKTYMEMNFNMKKLQE